MRKANFTYNNQKNTGYIFDSVNELRTEIEKIGPLEDYFNNQYQNVASFRRFSGYEGWEESDAIKDALTRTEYSRPELIADAKKQLTELNSIEVQAEKVQDNLVFNDLAGEFNLELFQDDAPDYMQLYTSAPTQAPRNIELHVNITYGASVDSENGIYNGLAAAIAAEKLEAAGYGVSIYAHIAGTLWHSRYEGQIAILAKSEMQRVNMSALAFILSDPKFFRTTSFAAVYLLNPKVVPGKGYGNHQDRVGTAISNTTFTSKVARMMPETNATRVTCRQCRHIMAVRDEVNRILQSVQDTAAATV